MAPAHLPETPRDRLRWAIRESLVIAGVLLFWFGLSVLLTVTTSLLSLAFEFARLHQLRPLLVLFRRVELLWPPLMAAALATVALYVLVRAGTLLVDHYRATAG